MFLILFPIKLLLVFEMLLLISFVLIKSYLILPLILEEIIIDCINKIKSSLLKYLFSASINETNTCFLQFDFNNISDIPKYINIILQKIFY